MGIIAKSNGDIDKGHFIISLLNFASITAATNLETPMPYDPIFTLTFFPSCRSTFASKGLELEAGEYIKTTFKRFKNPFLKHCLKDIAQNHQDKISRRIEEFLQWSNSLENLTKKHKLQGIVDEKDHF